MTTEELFNIINDHYVKYDPRDIKIISSTITMYQKDLYADICRRTNGWSLHIWQKHKPVFGRGCTDANPMTEKEVIATLDSYFERKKHEQISLF